jgi:hypothetical protein
MPLTIFQKRNLIYTTRHECMQENTYINSFYQQQGYLLHCYDMLHNVLFYIKCCLYHNSTFFHSNDMFFTNHVLNVIDQQLPG